MGELKALLPWQGQTLIAHQVSALMDGGVDRVVVVLGHRHEELRPELDGKSHVRVDANPRLPAGQDHVHQGGTEGPGQPGAGVPCCC